MTNTITTKQALVTLRTAIDGKATTKQADESASDTIIRAAMTVAQTYEQEHKAELPDMRVLKKQYKDAIKWDGVKSNMLTAARNLYRADGSAITIGKGDNATTYTIDANQCREGNAPHALQTIANKATKALADKAEAQGDLMRAADIAAQEMRNESATIAKIYPNAESLVSAMLVEQNKADEGMTHDEETLKAYKAHTQTALASVKDLKQGEEREAQAQKVLDLLDGLTINSDDGPAAKQLAELLSIADDETATIRIAAAA